MNTKNLNRRLKGYTKTSLRAGNEDSAVVDVIDDLQSITGDDDHSIDTSHDTSDVVDAEYAPNPAIITEMMTEINEEPEITNADTAFKLLSDSNEALRRLDIISMNVNYPVSGYRANNATILAAEPGLESLVPNVALSKRRLSRALESTKMELLKSTFKTFIKWLQDKINSGIAKLRSLFKSKPSAVQPVDIKTVADAMNSDETVKAPKTSTPQQGAIGYSKVEPKPERVRKTNQTKVTVDNGVIEMGTEVEEVPLKVYTRSKYEIDIWRALGHWGRHMVTNTEKSLTMISVLNELSEGVGSFLSSTAKLYMDVYSNEQETIKLVSNFKRDNNEFIIALSDYRAIQDEFIRRDTIEPPTMADFLSSAQLILKQEKTLGVDKFISTNQQSRDVFNAMNSLANNTHVSNSANNAALNEVKTVLLGISALYGTIPYTTEAMNNMHRTISKLAADVNKVKLAR